jgi:hypothetical protein
MGIENLFPMIWVNSNAIAPSQSQHQWAMVHIVVEDVGLTGIDNQYEKN